MDPAEVFVNRLAPNDILVVDGPAIIHVNREGQHIVLATNAPQDTGIVKVKGSEYRAIQQKHGNDAAAIVRDLKNAE